MAATQPSFALPRLVSYFLLGGICYCIIGTTGWALAQLDDKKGQVRDAIGGHLTANDNVAVAAVSVTFAGIVLLGLNGFAGVVLIPKLRKYEGKKSYLFGQLVFWLVMQLAWTAIAIADAVIVAKRSASVTVPGLPQAVVEAGLEAQGMSLAYRDNHPSVAYTICTWIAWLLNFVVLALVYMTWRSHRRGHTSSASDRDAPAADLGSPVLSKPEETHVEHV